MSRTEAKIRNQIGWYIVVWVVVATLLFIFLRSRHRKLYSQEKYEVLITTVSSRRLPAADPCQFFINGDPVTSEGNFARAIFYCDKQRQAISSMDLSVLPEDNYAALLRETGRVNGFSVEEMINPPSPSGFGEAKWKCFDDHERIENFSEKVKVRSRVECFFSFSDTEIKNFYENN